ncbi:MAG: hypothetical protein WA737_05695 [Candidatus Acidiferrales bacterium]
MGDSWPGRRKHTAFLVFIASLAVVLCYVGWVFYSRWQSDRDLSERAAAAQREKDREAVNFLGGDRFDILNFYAAPGSIHRGESLQLCYSVSNAKTVALDPPEAPVWPSFSRCVEVAPRKTTTYTLTATDAAGHAKTATLEIQVH